MDTQEEVEIELAIEEAKKHLAMRADLEKLIQSPEWKKVIDEGYLKDEAVRLVHIKAYSAFDSAEAQTRINQAIDAIGQLMGYFRRIQQNAERAEKALEEYEELRAERMAAEVLVGDEEDAA